MSLKNPQPDSELRYTLPIPRSLEELRLQLDELHTFSERLELPFGNDNVSSSMYELTFNSGKLSFNDLSYVNGLKPDNETYLCGESYWTGVEHDILGCNFKNWKAWNNGDVLKIINYVTDNNTLRGNHSANEFPDSFDCIENTLESTGEYRYPVCDSSSSSSGSSGVAGVWDQSTWDNSVFGD